MRQTMFITHAIGPIYIEAVLGEGFGDVAAAGGVAFGLDYGIGGLGPRIVGAGAAVGVGFNFIQCEDTERGDAVLTKVLVLVVAENHDEVRVEGFEGCSGHAESLDGALAVRGGGAASLVFVPFVAHRCGPRRGLAKMVR